MTPYAEAGKKNLLFCGDIHLHDTDEGAEVEVPNASILTDLLNIHEQSAPMTIEADGLGKVYKNGDLTSGPVSIPKSATFETIYRS